MTVGQYIARHYLDAVSAASGSNVHPATILAISALESGNGKSVLSKQYGNYFGFKGTSKYGSVMMPTKEFIGGRYITVDQPFRRYPSFYESAKDFVNLISTNRRYAQAINAANPIDQINKIWAAGYATDPSYTSKLTPIVNQAMLMAKATNHAVNPMTWIIVSAGLFTLIKTTLKNDR